MKPTTRYRIGERYYTVAEIALEAGISHPGVWARIRAGMTGHELVAKPRPKSTTAAETKIRQRLREAVRTKYKRTCPNCGCAFDIFQPARMLKDIKPGEI